MHRAHVPGADRSRRRDHRRGADLSRRADGPRLSATAQERANRSASPAMLAVAIVFTLTFAFNAAYAKVPNPPLSRTLGQLVTPTARALASGSVPGGGRHGRYLVTWTDPVAIGTQGFGLMNELERRGFTVGATGAEPWRGHSSPGAQHRPGHRHRAPVGGRRHRHLARPARRARGGLPRPARPLRSGPSSAASGSRSWTGCGRPAWRSRPPSSIRTCSPRPSIPACRGSSRTT